MLLSANWARQIICYSVLMDLVIGGEHLVPISPKIRCNRLILCIFSRWKRIWKPFLSNVNISTAIGMFLLYSFSRKRWFYTHYLCYYHVSILSKIIFRGMNWLYPLDMEEMVSIKCIIYPGLPPWRTWSMMIDRLFFNSYACVIPWIKVLSKTNCIGLTNRTSSKDLRYRPTSISFIDFDGARSEVI